ncbi:MAG: hypothetical protein ABIQ93_14865 [Saprospiraceae bacterium]
MIRSLFKLAVLLVVGILIYNYFFGTNSEQEQSKQVFGQMRNVVVSVGQLMKSEKSKYDAGKYDKVLDKLGDTYKAVRNRAKYLDEKVITRLDELEAKKARLQEDLSEIEQGDQQAAVAARSTKPVSPKTQTVLANKAADQQRRKEQLQRELEQLLHESDQLLQQAQQ